MTGNVANFVESEQVSSEINWFGHNENRVTACSVVMSELIRSVIVCMMLCIAMCVDYIDG